MIDLKETMPVKVEQILDVKGLHCPLPILKTKLQLNRMQENQILHVLTTDPLALMDFKAWAVHAPHKLIFVHEQEGQTEFFIQKIPV